MTLLDHYPGQPELKSLADKSRFVVTSPDEEPLR
jgi:hypothetical protein